MCIDSSHNKQEVFIPKRKGLHMKQKPHLKRNCSLVSFFFFFAILNSVILKIFFSCIFLCRNPTYTFSGREAGNSWHRGWPLGWEQTGPWGPWAFPPAGGFCWRASKRVSLEGNVYFKTEKKEQPFTWYFNREFIC